LKARKVEGPDVERGNRIGSDAKDAKVLLEELAA